MFTTEEYDQNKRALSQREKALTALDLIGPKSLVRSVLYPGTDSLTVRRNGAPKTATTVVDIFAKDGADTAHVTLSPRDARIIGMALIDAADEADGVQRLTFDTPDTPDLGASS